MQSQDYQDTPVFTDTVNITEDNEVLTTGRKQVNQYLFLETIGKGAFSKIKKCIKRENGKEEILAVKIVNKESLFRQRTVRYSADGESIMLNNLDKIYEEIDTWRLLNHPHIVKLYEVIDDDEYAKLYMVMEIADKGQIMEYSWEENTYYRSKEVLNFVLETLKNTKSIESLSETQKIELAAKWIFSQVLNGMEYLHDHKIVHRDIKLDNILVSSNDKGIVKLADFTVSKQLKSAEEICYDCEGTPLFTSPEVSFCLRDGYMPKPADIWGIGVCIYTYLTEVLPFNGESDIEVQIATKDKEYDIPEWMGEDLRDLLKGTLDKDPLKRYTIKQLKAHKWFNF